MTIAIRPREVVGYIVLAVAALALMLLALGSDGVDVAVIPTVTALTIRHFKKKKVGEDDGLEPDHPAVQFMFDAWNEGDFGDVADIVAPDCVISVNGDVPATDGVDGPKAVQQSIEYWRTAIPDAEMTLLSEVGNKHHIGVEFLITGTHTGDQPDLPASGNAVELDGAAFLTLDGKKVVEVSTIFDTLELARQAGAADASLDE